MSYLDNGAIRLGVDLGLGGAITYLSPSNNDENVVNSFDFGRQIQMSYYSGPVPFVVGDKPPMDHWRHLGWNPIQVGDDFGHASRIVEHRNDGSQLYVKCVPMQWPLDNVPGECTFESWIKLEGPTAHVRCRLNNARSDHSQYLARRQELPAVYTNGPYYRLMAYVGDKPFSGDALSQIVKRAGEPGPWTHWHATENWSALVRDDDFGLGVWHAGCYSFGGGFAGEPGKGGAKDAPTGYIAPGFDEIIDHDIRHEFQYALILGKLADIRRYVYEHADKKTIPDVRFERDRRHWHFVNARDAGWPVQGEWQVFLDGDDPQLIGPGGFWRAEDAPILYLETACRSKATEGQIFWKTFDEPIFTEDKSLTFALNADGEYRTYAVPLSSSPRYRGAITGLRFDPVPAGKAGDYIKVKAISAVPHAPK